MPGYDPRLASRWARRRCALPRPSTTRTSARSSSCRGRRQFLLHRDEYPDPGRACRDRDGDRHRPGAARAWRSLRPSGSAQTATVQDQRSAMEFRIYAEDPDTHMPSPGGSRIIMCRGTRGSGRIGAVRRLSRAGALRSADREADRARGGSLAPHWRWPAALREYLIHGIKTNIPLHLRILQDPDLSAGNFATDFLSRFEREVHPVEAARAAGR